MEWHAHSSSEIFFCSLCPSQIGISSLFLGCLFSFFFFWLLYRLWESAFHFVLYEGFSFRLFKWWCSLDGLGFRVLIKFFVGGGEEGVYVPPVLMEVQWYKFCHAFHCTMLFVDLKLPLVTWLWHLMTISFSAPHICTIFFFIHIVFCQDIF